MKILLISTNRCDDPYIVYPLGMSVIAGALHNAGHQVRQFDCLTQTEDIAAVITAFQPQLIGISIRNVDSVNSMRHNDNFIAAAADLVNRIKTISSAKIFLGGPGFSLLPQEILQRTGADYGIVGEGETAVLQLIDNISGGATSLLLSERIPVPQGARYDRQLVDFYHTQTHMIPLQSKRGCSFNCCYCTYPRLEGNCFRPRPTQAVIDEIKFLQSECGVEMIYFVDSIFNDPGNHYLTLLQQMKQQQINIPWVAFISPYKLSESALELMVETGFCWADVGGDGATDTTLRGLHKAFTFADIYATCKLLRDYGVSVSNSFMFGGPGETEATVREGISNIKSLHWVSSTVFPGIRILPGTPLEKIAIEKGLIRAGQNLLDAVYYIEPGLTLTALQEMLTEGFAGVQCCIYPPHAKNRQLQAIHRIGFKKIKSLL